MSASMSPTPPNSVATPSLRAGPCFSDIHTVIKYGGDFFLLKYKRRSLTFKNNHDNIREKNGVPLPQTKDVCVCVCVPRASLYVTNLLSKPVIDRRLKSSWIKGRGFSFFAPCLSLPSLFLFLLACATVDQPYCYGYQKLIERQSWNAHWWC
jgi:hypothetical protein